MGYYENTRWDIYSLIPANSKNILEIGCGNGWLGKALNRTHSLNIVGVDILHEIKNKECYDSYYQIDLNSDNFYIHESKFDVIVLADVLEHLIDPKKILNILKNYIEDGGILIVSLPNIQHYRVLKDLIFGQFEYQDEGILDRTHLRFFTRKSALDLFKKCDLQLYSHARNFQYSRKASLFRFASFMTLDDFFTFQNLFILKIKSG